MLAYNMVDGVTAWGIQPYTEALGARPWRDRWYYALKTFECLKDGNLTVPLWRDRPVTANTTAYGLELVVPTDEISISVHNTQSARYELLVSYDQGSSWRSLGHPLFGAGSQIFRPDKVYLQLPCYIKLDCKQEAEDGVLNGWISYHFRR